MKKVLDVLDVPETMSCVQLCMLEVPEVTSYVLLCNAGRCGGWAYVVRFRNFHCGSFFGPPSGTMSCFVKQISLQRVQALEY